MTAATLMTKREWLATQKGPDGKPLAIPGARGRFSHAAQAALTEAEAKGMKFAEPVIVTPKPKADKTVKIDKTKVKPDAEYDPKDVRAWATETGVQVGDRGRISADIVSAYLAANGGKSRVSLEKPAVTPKPAPPKKQVVMSVHIDRPKVRKETIAYGFARRKPEDGLHISEPLTQFNKCGKCKDGVAYCKCQPGPYTPAWMSNGKPEVALLRKPA